MRESGQCPVKRFLDDLAKKNDRLCAKVIARIKLFCDRGKIENPQQFKRLKGSSLFEIKQKPIRVYGCYKKGGRIILAHAFKKKRKDSLTRHETKAKKIIEEYERRQN